MNNKKEEYPNKIVTVEKITEDSKESYDVETIINGEFEEEAVKVAVEYQASFNRRDPDGCDKMLNFPHARLGMRTNDVIVTENPPQIPKGFFEWFMKDYGWNHSCWDYRKVIQSNSDKVHLQIQFSRYRSDGSKIGTFPSLWIITKQDNHWGIKMRSSFAQ